MKIKFYAKQVNPEYQEDNLFYNFKNKKTGHYELGWNDDAYVNDIIIYGNKDYHHYYTDEFEKLLQLDSVYYEYEPLTYPKSNHCYWNNITEFINAYFPKTNGKYSKKEIHEWKVLLETYSNRWELEDIIEKALQLMTGKKWRSFTIRGYCQGDWQEGYASEEVSNKDIKYIEMCYFNTGSEYIVYEDRHDFTHNENGCSFYCDSYNSKSYLADLLGCEEKEISMYDWDGYTKTPKYKHV